jgi:hypothetical protein
VRPLLGGRQEKKVQVGRKKGQPKMHGLLEVFAKWLEGSPWGVGVRTSLWAYPFTQLIHFTGLSIWIGTNLALDLRLLGVGKRRETAAQLAEDLFAWNWIGFCIVLLGGFLLFSSTATTFIVNVAFRWKLGIFVPLALLWHIFVQRKARDWGATHDTPAIAKFSGLAEILLWVCVITAAVEIPNH